MSGAQDIRVPDIGDFEGVEVIEVLVAPGDQVAAEDALITLESDKAAMDIPAPAAGVVTAVHVRAGDKVSEGDVIASYEPAADAGAPASEPAAASAAPAPAAAADDIAADREADLVVIGAGVAGYTAAFRAADLGRRVLLVERWPSLGGVCLNVGCIPSKALLHAAKVIDDAAGMAAHGVDFGGPPRIDSEKLAGWKDSVVERLTGGLSGMARQRKVERLHGVAQFRSPHVLAVANDDGETTVRFAQCIVAAGSEPTALPGAPDDPRVMDSTGALTLQNLPERLLVIGGGIIGLEMATVYNALGSEITVIELTKNLMPEADQDLVRIFKQLISKRYSAIRLGTKVNKVDPDSAGVNVTYEDGEGEHTDRFEMVLVSIGRRPNGKTIDADNAGVTVDERGFIPSDKQMRTNVPHIFSIGDIRGNPMLAHKGSHEGKVAAEVAAGHKRAFDARVIPSVAYTDPEVAWVGPTEAEMKRDGIAFEKAVFPWAASGRALALGVEKGMTKLMFDKETKRVIGMGAVGTQAGDLVSEAALAIEMGCDAEDIGLTIHPHPTLSETVAMAAEVFDGSVTDIIAPKR